MPTKTERILSYLPRTFRSDLRKPVLRTLIEAFGSELLAAENSLAAVMAAHWVDHADRRAVIIDDLRRMAALYGLLPRDDESVEEFREHLKRYVRTFLEGTVTVQGLLRVSAEALNLHIADRYEDADVSKRLDTWWTRAAHFKTIFEPRFDDAAPILFGFAAATVVGSSGETAQVVGTISLGARIDTRQRRFLSLTVDSLAKVVDLQKKADDPARATRSEITGAINDEFGSEVAAVVEQSVNGFDLSLLKIESPTSGTESKVSVVPLLSRPESFDGRFVSRAIVTDEAAQSVLGFVKRVAFGTAATSFVLISGPQVDLTRGIDLREQNILKVAVDGQPFAEIDCAGSRPRATLRDEVIAAINDKFPGLASAEGKGIKLTSPTAGTAGSILLQDVDKNASSLLFGATPSATPGQPAGPATLIGDTTVLGAVDLSQRSKIRLSVNNEPPIDIDVAGASPAETFLDEIVAAINAVFPEMASATDDDKLKLSAPVDADSVATSLAVLPLRYIDLIEYPPNPVTQNARPENAAAAEIRHGDKWTITNKGACDATATVLITAPAGTVGPTIINRSLGYKLRIMQVIERGDQVKLWVDHDGKLRVTLITDKGEKTFSDPAAILDLEKLDNAENKFHKLTDQWPDAKVLTLPQGESHWGYLDCHGSRFDRAKFASQDEVGGVRFAGGTCQDRGTFNSSTFENREGTTPPEGMTTVFSSSQTSDEPGVVIQFAWGSRDPGAFVINLPNDLPERFGGRFNAARFGKRASPANASGSSAAEKDPGEQVTPNRYKHAVTEPDSDPNYLLNLIPQLEADDGGASLVKTAAVPLVPLGFEAATLPFREPTYLSGGTDTQPARIYLAEDGREGFIVLQAKEAGTWGNQIYLTAHTSGPAMFDIVVGFAGSRFENARSVVRGDPAQSSTKKNVQPGRVGVLQAKAAGIHADVTRNRARASNQKSL